MDFHPYKVNLLSNPQDADQPIDYTNSHDLIATLMQQNLSCMASIETTNEAVAKKTALFERLFTSLDESMSIFLEKPGTSPEALVASDPSTVSNLNDIIYGLFTNFTREYIQMYLPVDKPIDIRFKPFDEVDKKSKLFQHTCDYIIGMSTVSHIDIPSQQTLSTKSYIELLFLVAWKLTNMD